MTATTRGAARLSRPVPLRRRPRAAGVGQVEVAGLGLVAIALVLLAHAPVSLPATGRLPLALALALMAALSRAQRLGPWRVDAAGVTPAFVVASLVLLGPAAALLAAAGVLAAELGLGGGRPRPLVYALTQADAALAGGAVAHVLGARFPLGATAVLIATVLVYAIAWRVLELPEVMQRRRHRTPGGIGALEALARAALLGLAGASLGLLWQVGPLGLVCGALSLVFLNREVTSSHFGREAIVESKTGLFNSRYFQEVLESEIERSRRLDRATGLLMCDLDHLREVNNRHGHATGDVVIRRVAEVIRAGTRSFDVPARFGGEEFAVLLPETSKRRARAIAERLRRALAAERFEALTPSGRPSGVIFQVTMSVGVAAFPEDAQGGEALLGRADAAAYAAKRAGRNRVELFGVAGLVEGEAVADARHRVDVARPV